MKEQEESNMSKKGNYFQKKLGLDAKTSEAIKILMDEGLLNDIEKRRKKRRD